jgi:hypothetical protein
MLIDEICDSALEPAEEQLYGIEIELEDGQDIPAMRDHLWRVESDGSLRHCGIEFVSKALTIEEVAVAIEQVYGWMDKYGYTTSHRTGIHIHMDMRHRTPAQISGILTAYAALEPVLFAMVGADREQNIYCIPWYRALDQAEVWPRHGPPASRTLNRVCTRSCKYSALYLEPLYRFGTLEFRHAPTFSDVEELAYWIEALTRLVRYGEKHTPSAILNDILSKGEDEWARGILGDVLPPWVVPSQLMDAADSISVAEVVAGCESLDGWRSPEITATDGRAIGYHSHVFGRRA